jgi:hypothetical protein
MRALPVAIIVRRIKVELVTVSYAVPFEKVSFRGECHTIVFIYIN